MATPSFPAMRIGMLGLKGIPFAAGIENFTEQIGWRLAARGHEVTVYVRPYVDVGSSYRGMPIRRLPSINTKHLDAISHTFLASLDVLFRDLDVVHYHALGPSVFSLLPRLRGVKTVVHVHGLDWQREKWSPFASRCLRSAEYTAVYFPHRTIAISTGLKGYLEHKYRRPVDYVPTGVERYEYREPREITKWGLGKEDYILFLSRLVPEKGCHYLIEAYERLSTNKRLVIAGPSTGAEAYAAGLRGSQNPNILFTGGVTGRLLEELFSNAYTFVLPSEVEGLPHALLQALSHGRCVLASDIEGNLEALGGCGLTFRSRDQNDLREKLQYLLDNPDFVQGCAAGAQARVREVYSWETVVDNLEAIYAGHPVSPGVGAVLPAGH
jgi:glycosyltransferase involved in cell wall biosynthesis